MELLVWGFLKRKREFFFLGFFYFFLPLTIFFTLSSQKPYINFEMNFLPHFSTWFFQKRGVFIGKMREWEASISVLCYTSASHPFKEVARYANASSILIHHVICLISIFRLFLIFGLIFVQLFGGLSELLFLWISYSRKAIDV